MSTRLADASRLRNVAVEAIARGFRRAALAAFALLSALTILGPSAAGAAPGCTKYAAPGGNDAAVGSESAPLRTAQKLVESLSTGETGCLRAGAYNENVNIREGGEAGAPLTLRSYPGERAQVVGILYVARTAPHVTVEELDLNGRNAEHEPSVQVNAEDTTFRLNDVTNENTGICLILGHEDWGRAIRTVVEQNRIHDCGRLPPTNFDHGIYVAASDGVVISKNWIYDNADWGVHLYPDAQSTLVERNVIDGNGKGVIFAGEGGTASSNNVVQENVITNSKERFNVASWWADGNPVGQGNVVRRNCVSGGAKDQGNGGIEEPAVGFTVEGTITADPGFVDRAARNFGLEGASPCRDFVPPDVPTGRSGQAEPGSGTEAERREPKRLTVRLSAPGRRYVAAVGHVQGSGRGTVQLTAFYARAGRGFHKVRSRAAAVRDGRFQQRLAPFRRGRWRLEGRVKGAPSVVDAGRARLEDEGAGAHGAQPPLADDGRRALEAAEPESEATLDTAEFGDLEEPGPLAGGGYVAIGRWARPGLVGRIQDMLSLAGFDVPSDGVFGPHTESAVMRFQRTHGLMVDGIVGRQTMAALEDY